MIANTTDAKLYEIALLEVPGIGNITAKTLLKKFGNARNVFEAPKSKLLQTEGIGEGTAEAIKKFKDFSTAEKELAFLQKHNLVAAVYGDEIYPKRLMHIMDISPVIYLKGNVNLQADKIVGIVGTRSNTDHGRTVTEKIVEGFKGLDVTIISGLAYGIDTIAHKAALKQGLPTIGVVGHGLHTVYPGQNKSLALEMEHNGGLASVFRHGTKPDKINFPERNKVVAGLCDALVIIESTAGGGSMITANMALNYKKDLYAVPGRITDSRSEGPNQLIKNRQAKMLTSAADIITDLKWNNAKPTVKPQRQLFVELTPNEKIITDLLQQTDGLHIDEITLRTELTTSAIAQALLMLEMQNLVASLPGKMYKLI